MFHPDITAVVDGIKYQVTPVASFAEIVWRICILLRLNCWFALRQCPASPLYVWVEVWECNMEHG